MHLNEINDDDNNVGMTMPTALSSASSSSSSSSSSGSSGSSVLVRAKEGKEKKEDGKTGSDSCLTRLMVQSARAQKIQQLSRKLSEFDAKLNGFKSRSGHLSLTNSTTTSKTPTRLTATATTRSTATNTTTTTSPTTGPRLIRSSLTNFSSLFTNCNSDNQQQQHETLKVKHSDNIDDCESQLIRCNSLPDCDLRQSKTVNLKRSIRRITLPHNIATTITPNSSTTSSRLSSASLSSPVDRKLGSTNLFDFEVNQLKSNQQQQISPTARKMRTTSQLISIRRQGGADDGSNCNSTTKRKSLLSQSPSSSAATLPVGYVNNSQSATETTTTSTANHPLSPNRVSRFNKSSSRVNRESTNSLCSSQSYSRLNSLPGSTVTWSNNGQSSKPARSYLRASSIPNGLNGRLSDNETLLRCNHNDFNGSRESVNSEINCQRVGSLLDSPKWSSIKEKFEKSSHQQQQQRQLSNQRCQPNMVENKDKIETSYSPPQPRRKSFPISSNLQTSSSLSNLTLLSSNNRGRSTSFPTDRNRITPAMENKSTTVTTRSTPTTPSISLTNRESSNNSFNNRSSSQSTSTFNSSTSSLTNVSLDVRKVDHFNRFSTNRFKSSTSQQLISKLSSTSHLSPSSPSYSLDNHGNNLIENHNSVDKSQIELNNQSSKMKNNSRIAEIASKFDVPFGVGGSVGSLTNNTSTSIEFRKIASDLLSESKTITTTTMLTVQKKSSSECNKTNYHQIYQKQQQSVAISSSSSSLPSTPSINKTSVSTPPTPSSATLSNWNINDEEKLRSVKETIRSFESSSSLSSSSNLGQHKINRSTSDQLTCKPIINPRRKTLPGAGYPHKEAKEGGDERDSDLGNSMGTRSGSYPGSIGPHTRSSNNTNNSDAEALTSTQRKPPSLTSQHQTPNEIMKNTPSFPWNDTLSNRSIPAMTREKREDESQQHKTENSNSNNNNNNQTEEPFYEPVSYSPTSLVKNSSLASPASSSREFRPVFPDYDDNLSLNSENSNTTYSDSGSYSSGVGLSSESHEVNHSSSTAFSSSFRINRGINLSGQPVPPPLPPRWTENKVAIITTPTNNSSHFNHSSSPHSGQDDYYSDSKYNSADHIYDSIHYNALPSEDVSTNKREALSKLLAEFEDMSPDDESEKKIKDEISISSIGTTSGMSRTPSTLSFSSISRNGSNASESLEARGSGDSSVTPRSSSENSSPQGSFRSSSSSTGISQVPPKPTPRTTIKSLKKSDNSSSGHNYANFPSILELSPPGLMDDILEGCSDLARETIQKEIKREEYHHSSVRSQSTSTASSSSSLHRSHHRETLSNQSFLHSNRESTISRRSADYVEAIDPSAQRKPNSNDLYREGQIYPESRYEVTERYGYMEFSEIGGFFSSTADQPLYQEYNEQVKHNRILWASGLGDDSQNEESDPIDAIYAELEGESKCDCDTCERTDGAVQSVQPSPHKTSAIDLVGKNGYRQLWCEVPQVKESGVAAKLNLKERKHQEAMFEVITSEASYLKSLDILINHFMKSEEFSNPEILKPQNRADLFSNIEQVAYISRRLMKDLDDRWQTNVIISDVCDILYQYATKEFGEYVKYLRFYKEQEKILKTLTKSNQKFAAAVKQLESDPKCRNLELTSFLLLPMQRITRYPLLVEAILYHRQQADPKKLDICQKTLETLNKVGNACNEATKATERLQELVDLSKVLIFPLTIKSTPLCSESRYLMKKDEVIKWKQVSANHSILPARNRSVLWKKEKSPAYLFLFNDLLVMSKKKSDTNYLVTDYCKRACLQVQSLEQYKLDEDELPPGIKSDQENVINLTLLENHAKQTSQYFIAFPTETDKIRFVEAIEPPKSEKPNEKIYDKWDCPFVICDQAYTAQQPDELSIESGDIIKVRRKTNDWYEGERTTDSAKGWFPASCTHEIQNEHVKNRTRKLRHQLMMLTAKHNKELPKS